MRAVTVSTPTGIDVLTPANSPEPVARPGEVVEPDPFRRAARAVISPITGGDLPVNVADVLPLPAAPPPRTVAGTVLLRTGGRSR